MYLFILEERGSILGSGNISLFSIAFRPALGATQPPVVLVPGGFFLGDKADGGVLLVRM
jgi:hypothetical protein